MTLPRINLAWSKRAGCALFLVAALLFLIANRGAYKGFFQDDEIDNLTWAPAVSKAIFAQNLLTPQFLSYNFRPVGHFYFHLAGRYLGLDFPKYLFPIHALHLLNVWLLWLVVRRMGVGPFGAAAGCLFFAFHMAAFDVYWKPMYVFDLLCATFCLLSLLLYLERRLVLSFAAFWLAYKSKELAVMLPAVLILYELWLGKRRWKPLIPFFAVALSFGLQGLLLNKNENNDYSFYFTPGSVFVTARFYASAVLLFPYAGFVLPVIPFFTRDRRVWLGIAAMLLLFLPLAFLRNRTFDAYCYVPLIGLAIAVAAIAEIRHRTLVAAFFLLWIPWNEFNLRLNRRRALAIADENRAYVTAIGEAARRYPDTRVFLYDVAPFAFHRWGVESALRYYYRTQEITLANMADREAPEILKRDRIVILSWDALRRKLVVTSRDPGAPDAAYITMDPRTPLWQLLRGWYSLDNTFRWIQPDAVARLHRPAGARRFELTVNIPPLRDYAGPEVEVRLNGTTIGKQRFFTPGWQTARWELRPESEGPVEVAFHVTEAFRAPEDPRSLGVAVVAFGFVK